MRKNQRASRWIHISPKRAIVLLGGVMSFCIPATHIYADVCDVTNIGACVDKAQYDTWYGLAGSLWNVNRSLLQAAYTVDWIHWSLVHRVFGAVYGALAEFVRPGFAPVATIAIMLGALLFLVMPITGRINVVNVRQALLWAIGAPWVLAVSGPMLIDLVEARMEVGNTLFLAASDLTLNESFGARADEMPTTNFSIYQNGNNDCGTLLSRPFRPETTGPGATVLPVQMDDLAAAMLYADVQDIHCPERRKPSPDIPDRFYQVGWANVGGVGNLEADSDRQKWIDGIQRGTTRLGQGILVSLLAVLNSLIQLLFDFALVLLWLTLPLALLFVFFDSSSGAITTILRRTVAIIKASWIASILLGILFAIARGMAERGNATNFVGIALGGLFLMLYLLIEAGRNLISTLQTVTATVGDGTILTAQGLRMTGQTMGRFGQSTGMQLAGMGRTAQSVANMAASARAARSAGASPAYAAMVAAGRMRWAAHLGSLAAAAAGKDSEWTDGLLTGRRAANAPDGLRAVRRFAQTDAERKPKDGSPSMGERSRAAALQRAALQHWQTAPMHRLQAVAKGKEAPLHAVSTTALPDGTMLAALPTRRDVPASALHDRLADVDVGRLLQLGYEVQHEANGHVAYWPSDTPVEPPAPPVPVGDPPSSMALLPSGPQRPAQWRKARTRAQLTAQTEARRMAAQAELHHAKQRQTLITQGVLGGSPAAAAQQVQAAQRRVDATAAPRLVRPRPAMGHAPRLAAPPNTQARQRIRNEAQAWRYRPGQALPPQVQPPTPTMLRQTTPDQVVRLDDHGQAVIASHPQVARPAEVIQIPAQRVRNLDKLLQQGYAATHDNGIVTAWPIAAHPDHERLPDGRLDVDREQRRLEQSRMLQAAHRPSPTPAAWPAAASPKEEPSMKRVIMLLLIAIMLPLPSAAQGTVQAGPWDRWENNYDPAHAAQLVLGEALTNLNFVCPQRPFEQLPPNCMDTDWFWIAVRGGACYTAETRDLAAGVDTNLIIYGPETDKAAPLAGNDNASAGELRSAATVCLPSEPVQQRLYLLVGQVGDLPPPPPVAERTYTLVVSALQPTPVPAPPAPPTATPEPPIASDGPTGQAVVVAPSAALHTTPSGPVVQTLEQGQTVQLLGTSQGTWVRVQPKDGVVPGWIEAAQLRRMLPTPSPAPDSVVPRAPTPTAPLPTVTITPTVQASPTVAPIAPPPVPTEEPLPVEVLPVLPLPTPPVPALRSLDLTVEVRGAGASRAAQAPLVGVRVQLVDAFGEVLAEAVTDGAGKVRWTRAVDPTLALWVQLPNAGVRAQLDAAEVTAGMVTVRVVLPRVDR